MEQLLALLLGYLLGSIPFGLLLSHAAGLGDIRKIGSGNIGATNVLRTGRKWLAATTLLLDLGKGFVAVFLAWRMFPFIDSAFTPQAFAALGAVLGHCFPVWLRFKGGKGVATNAGVVFGLAWPIGLAYALVWLGILAITRTSSMAGMGAVFAALGIAGLVGASAFIPVLAVIAALVVTLHHENLARIRAGTEPRIGRKE